jgi:thymidylate synthase
MKQYLDIVRTILKTGVRKANRTGTDTLSVAGMLFRHDMALGFPILTTKVVPFRLVASEIEFFVRGITDKRWLIERNNHIWDEWCSPRKVPYGRDEATKKRMLEERDLGPIYGFQWRHFGAEYRSYDAPAAGGIDQLAELVAALKKNPESRRMIVSAWNPAALSEMALPPCHYGFQVTVADGRLNLMWNQRSVDVALGLPFNIAGYGLLLHLLAKEAGLAEGILAGFLGDVHIYENHIDGLNLQLQRRPRKLPTIGTTNFKSVFDWVHTDSSLEKYAPHPKIPFEVAV